MSHTQLSIAYSDDRIGLELSIDLSDFFIYALIFKPVGDHVPVGYHDGSGRRHKLYLQQALKELSIDVSKETKRLQELSGNFKNCGEMVLVLSSLIHQYWASVSKQPDRWFQKSWWPIVSSALFSYVLILFLHWFPLSFWFLLIQFALQSLWVKKIWGGACVPGMLPLVEILLAPVVRLFQDPGQPVAVFTIIRS